jgi:hypothetical protein
MDLHSESCAWARHPSPDARDRGPYPGKRRRTSHPCDARSKEVPRPVAVGTGRHPPTPPTPVGTPDRSSPARAAVGRLDGAASSTHAAGTRCSRAQVWPVGAVTSPSTARRGVAAPRSCPSMLAARLRPQPGVRSACTQPAVERRCRDQAPWSLAPSPSRLEDVTADVVVQRRLETAPFDEINVPAEHVGEQPLEAHEVERGGCRPGPGRADPRRTRLGVSRATEPKTARRE